jgi:hypothetical protein
VGEHLRGRRGPFDDDPVAALAGHEADLGVSAQAPLDDRRAQPDRPDLAAALEVGAARGARLLERGRDGRDPDDLPFRGRSVSLPA